MKKILFSFCLMQTISLFAQTPKTMMNYGGGSDDVSYAICKDDASNIYSSGYFSQNITLNGNSLTSAGGKDIYITKHDINGNVLWSRKAGGSGDDATYSISYNAGFIYISGVFRNTATFETQSLISKGLDDAFLAKYDTSGNFIWAKNVGGSSALDRADKLVFKGNNTMYLCASIFSGSKYNNVGSTLTNNGGSDIYILTLDTAGNLLNYINIGGTSNDYVYDMKLIQNRLYIAGNFASTEIDFGTTAKLNRGSYDAYVAAYDTALNEVWSATGGGGSNDSYNKVLVDSLNNCYVTGSFSSSALFGSISLQSLTGGVDGCIAKYSSTGMLQWTIKQGAKSSGEARELSFGTQQNTIRAWGIFAESLVNGQTYPSNGLRDYCILTLDNNGIVNDVKTFGGTGEDIATEVAVVGNTTWLTGVMSQTSSFNGNSKNSNGGLDIALWKFSDNPTTGLSDTDYSLSGLTTFYPNPASQEITIESEQKIQSIEIFDLKGVKVLSYKESEKKVTIPLNLQPGFYMIHVITDNGVQVKKLTIE